jgi:2-polyprenyl-3-methyl-5-hydroxy-6-metoxy-1,4-benzoquinol methylase
MTWDPVWEEIFNQQGWGSKYPSEDLIRFVARNFYKAPVRGDIKILEVGCGPGANLWYMAREGFSVYGIDGSKMAIDRAREMLNQDCPGWKGELLVGDMADLSYDNQFFDAVVDHEAIYSNSYEDSKVIIKELDRVLKKNGKLFSRTFASGCWGYATGEKVGHNAWIVSEGPIFNKGYARFTDLAEIPDLFTGFKINEVELLTRTVENRCYEIKEWVVIAEKM